MAPDRADRPWTPATTSDGEIVAGAYTGGAAAGYVLPANSSLEAALPSPEIDPAKAYSLADLIDIGESTNPMTRIAWNDARRVALAAGIARSLYLPKITATAIGGYQGSSGHDTALDTGYTSNPSVNGTVAAVSLQWLLFDFGERAAVVDTAKQATVISNIAFTAAHQEVIYEITLAFYTHAAAQARVHTASQAIANAQVVQAAAEERYAHGIGTVIEVAQARQNTAQAQLAVVQTTGAAEDSTVALLTAAGLSPLATIKTADVSGRMLLPSVAAPVSDIIMESLSRRPDVLSAYAAEKASVDNVRRARAEFLPKFFLSANGNYNSGKLDVTALPSAGQQSPTINISGNHLGGSIFAGVTVPLYDGGTRAATLAQAHAEQDRASAHMIVVRNDAVRQIVVSDNTLRTSLAAFDASQHLVVATQTTFNAALAAYRSGVGSITELTLAETQLLQAKNAATDAYSSALSAAAALALATGALGSAPPQE
jgi:outer membrane protein TolC